MQVCEANKNFVESYLLILVGSTQLQIIIS